jgi:hypothetical protein
LINDTLSNWYTCIYFLNDFTGWVTKAGISYERILKTTDVGDTWVNIPTEINYPLKKIIFFNENTGYGLNGQQCKTTNGGTNWIYQEIAPVPGGFNDIDFIDINTGWAVSYEGSIYKTTNGGLIPVSNISTEVPKSFSLYQNYPNPFNPVTKIKFDIPTPPNPPFGKGGTAKPGGFVKLVIYDVLGREVEVLLNEGLQPGTYTVTWDASNFPSGVYFYKLTIDDASAPLSICKKMVLIK